MRCWIEGLYRLEIGFNELLPSFAKRQCSHLDPVVERPKLSNYLPKFT